MAKESVGQDRFSFPPWLPVAASIVLMIMVAIVASINAKNLKKATLWRRHSTQVILAAQTFENNLLDMQRGMRGYVVLGDTNALASFYNCTILEQQALEHLNALTTDSADQQERIKSLNADMAVLLNFDNGAIALYRREGFPGISKLDATGQSRAIFGRTDDVLKQFLAKEQELWDIRDASEQSKYHYAGHMLVIGSVLAALLLLLATYLAGRELKCRRKAEAELREALLLQKAILNCADYGIVSTNLEGVVQTFNAAAEHMLGYSAAEVVDKATPMLWRDQQEVAERAQKLSGKLGMPVEESFDVVAKKVQADGVDESEWTFVRKNGSRFPTMIVATPLGDDVHGFAGYLGIFRDITDRKRAEKEKEALIAELKKTLLDVKTLSGMIPICAWCKNVRSDTGYWQTVEQYVRSHSDARFSHGVCPSCSEKLKKGVAEDADRAKSNDIALFLQT
jgi:PAS domain S-box-containing protein